MKPSRTAPLQEEVAIIGASCRFADVPNLTAFWRRIVQGTPTPADQPLALGSLYACSAEIPFFRDASWLKDDPCACFVLQLITDALRDANIPINNTLQIDRTGLFVCHNPVHSATSVNWLQQTLLLDQTLQIIRAANPHLTAGQYDKLREAWQRALPPLNRQTIESAWRHLLPTRLAQTLGVIGPATLCDTGWTSGITAMEQAVDSLRANRCDMAIITAIQPPLSATTRQGLEILLPHSTRRHIQTFDREANGVTLAEGGITLILKRLRDAQTSGDPIYAIIRGTGTAIARTSATGDCAPLQVAPLADALVRSMFRACKDINNTLDTVDLYEAHASGLPAQDQAELRFLQTVTGQRTAPLVIGSVKSAIGHTLNVSALAGVLKAALALSASAFPPSNADDKELQRLSPNLCTLPAPRPWIAISPQNRPRRAAVVSMDFSGSTALAVLEAPNL